MKECRYCGKEFVETRKRRIFCSDECYAMWNGQSTADISDGGMELLGFLQKQDSVLSGMTEVIE